MRALVSVCMGIIITVFLLAMVTLITQASQQAQIMVAFIVVAVLVSIVVYWFVDE